MKHSEPPPQDSALTWEATGELDGAFSDDGVDLTLIRWMLGLSPKERLEAAQDMIDTVWMLREGRET